MNAGYNRSILQGAVNNETQTQAMKKGQAKKPE